MGIILKWKIHNKYNAIYEYDGWNISLWDAIDNTLHLV